jgi:hypothetical protein
MRDPHVASLTYLAISSKTASFDQAPPLEGTLGGCRFFLGDGKLRIEPSIHFPRIEQAKNYVDQLLESWEIDIALRFGNSELSFKYETAEVIEWRDRCRRQGRGECRRWAGGSAEGGDVAWVPRMGIYGQDR